MEKSVTFGVYGSRLQENRQLDRTARAGFLYWIKHTVLPPMSKLRDVVDKLTDGNLDDMISNNKLIHDEYEEYKKRYFSSLPSQSPRAKKVIDLSHAIMGMAEEYRNWGATARYTQNRTYIEDFAPVANYILNNISANPDPITQSTSQFLKKVVNTTLKYQTVFGYNVKQQGYELEDSIKNIRRQNKFEVFDLEGTGDYITEYAFGTGHIKDKSFSDVVHNIIGYNDTQYQNIKAKVDALKKAGINDVIGFKSDDEYILKYLYRVGHKDTQIGYKGGRAFFKSIIGNDFVDTTNIATIERGLEILHNIGKQARSNTSTFEYKGQKYDIYGFEQDILKKLIKVKNENMTLVSHNGLSYDNTMLYNYFMRGNASQGAKDLWSRLFPNSIKQSIPHYFDSLAFMREFVGTGDLQNKKIAEALAKSGESENTATAMAIRLYPAAASMARNAIEQMGAKYVEHVGVSDVLKQGFTIMGIMDQNNILDPKYKYYAFRNLDKTSQTHVGDMFFIKNGNSLDTNLAGDMQGGMLSFTQDQLTHDIQFAGGVQIRADGTSTANDMYVGLKKNTMYMLSGIQELDMTPEYRKAMASAVGPDVAASELIHLSFVPVRSEDSKAIDTFRDTTPVHIITTRDNAKLYLARAGEFVGQMDLKAAGEAAASNIGKDNWEALSYQDQLTKLATDTYLNYVSTEDVSKRTRWRLSYAYPEKDGAKSLSKDDFIQDLFDKSRIVRENDAASRWIRGINYKKAKMAIEFVDAIQGQQKQLEADGTPMTVTDILNEYVSDAKIHKENSELARIFDYNGGQDKKRIYSGTIDNAVQSYHYLASINDLNKFIIQKTDELALSASEKPYIYNYLFNEYMSALALVDGEESSSRAYGKIYLPQTNLDKNMFAVDVSALMRDSDKIRKKAVFSTSAENNILTINLDDDNTHIGRRLADMMGMDSSKKGVPAQALRLLQGYLHEQYNIKFKSQYNSQLNEDTLTSEIIRGLRRFKKENPDIQTNRHPAIMDVSNAFHGAKAFSKLNKADLDTITKNIISNMPTFISGTPFTMKSNGMPDKDATYGKINVIVNDYVDNYLFKETNNITEADLYKYGYSKRDAKRLIQERELRRSDAKEMMEDIFRRTLGEYRYMSYTIGPHGELSFWDSHTGNQFDFTKQMMFDKFDSENGLFFTQLGEQRLASTIGFIDAPERDYIQTTSFRTSIRSIIGSQYAFMKRILPYMNASDRTESAALKYLNFVFTQAHDNIGFQSVTRRDAQDKALGDMISLEGFFSRLGGLNHEHQYDAVHMREATRNVLNSLTEKMFKNQKDRGVEDGDLTSEIVEVTADQKGVLLSDIHAILEPFKDPESDASKKLFNTKEDRQHFSDLISTINNVGIKKVDNAIVSLTYDNIVPFMDIGPSKRHMESMIKRALKLQNPQELLDKDYMQEEYHDAIRFGTIIRSESEARAIVAGGNVDEKFFRVNKLSMNTDTLYKILRSKESKAILDGLNNPKALYAYLEESAGLMNPYLINMIPKNLKQSRSSDNLADIDQLYKDLGALKAGIEENRRRKTREVVQMVKDGVHFQYGKGAWINAGEEFAYYNSFRSTTHGETAKDSGFLKIEYKDDNTGKYLTEQEVNEFLNRKENLQELQKTAEESRILKESPEAANYRLRQRVTELLSAGKIKRYYTIESADAMKFRKVEDVTEKTMSDFLMPYLGEESKDTQYQRFISKLGLKDKKLFLLDSVLEDKNKFALLVGGVTKNEYVNTAYIDKIANDMGYSYDKFVREAQHERGVYWDALVRALKANGYLKAGETISAIGNTLTEAIKSGHQEGAGIQGRLAQAVRTIANNTLGDGQHTREELGNAFAGATQQLYDELVKSKAITTDGKNSALNLINDTESMSVNNEYVINMKAFEAVLDKYAPLNARKDAILGEGVFAAVSDADRGGSKIKATRRMIAAAQQEGWGQNVITSVFGSYKKLENLYGKSSFNAEEEFKKGYSDVAIIGEDGKAAIRQEAIGQAVNNPFITSIQREIVAGDSAEHIVYDTSFYKSETEKKIGNLAKKIGISEKHLYSLVENTVKAGYKTIGESHLLSQYAYASASAAMQLNNTLNAGNLTKEQQLKVVQSAVGEDNLFQDIISIDKLNSIIDQKNANDVDRVLNRPIVIDLGEELTSNAGARYVALPFIHSTIMDDKNDEGIISRNAVVNKASSIAYGIEQYKGNGELHRDAIFQEQKNKVDELIKLVVAQASSKEGALAQATSGYLNGSYSGKHRAVRISADNELLRKASINGTSIAKLEEAGVHSNAIFLGKDFFDKALMNDEMMRILGNNANFDKVEAAKNAVLDSLKTEGAIGIGLRQPMEYMNSLAGAHIYYDENLSSNEIKITESLAKGANADSDGDITYAHMLRDRAIVANAKGGDVQAATLSQGQAKLLEKLGYTVTFANDGKLFKDAERAAYTIANSALTGMNTDETPLTTSITTENYGETNLRRMMVDGYTYSQMYLDNRRNVLGRRYDDISQSQEFKDVVAQQVGKGYKVDDLTLDQLTGTDGVAQTFLSTIKDADARRSAGEAIAYHLSEVARDEEITATAAKASAGLSNTTIFATRNIINTLKDRGMTRLTDSEAEIVGNMLTHLSEATLAAKHTSAGQNAIAQLSNGIHRLFGVSSSNYKVDPISDSSYLEKFFSSLGEIKEFNKLPLYDDLKDVVTVNENTGEKELNMEKVMTAWRHILPENKILTQELFDSTKQGYSRMGAYDDTMIANKTDLARLMQENANELYKEVNQDVISGFEDKDILREGKPVLTPRYNANNNGSVDPNEAKFREFATEGAEQINSDFEDLNIKAQVAGTMKNIAKGFSHSKAGALGMLGFAGLTMMAGVMGGAPTSPTPAQGQAQGIQSEDASYEIPSVMPHMGNGNNAGYIINVNASTDRGREFAEDAINNAMQRVSVYGQQGGNANVTMNIKDSASNISYSNIASYVSSML